jgi:hypothetical protein
MADGEVYFYLLVGSVLTCFLSFVSLWYIGKVSGLSVVFVTGIANAMSIETHEIAADDIGSVATDFGT